MANYFDNLVFSSSLTIFITALILVFLYEFFSSKTDVKSNNLKISENLSKKSTKNKQDRRIDRVD